MRWKSKDGSTKCDTPDQKPMSKSNVEQQQAAAANRHPPVVKLAPTVQLVAADRCTPHGGANSKAAIDWFCAELIGALFVVFVMGILLGAALVSYIHRQTPEALVTKNSRNDTEPRSKKSSQSEKPPRDEKILEMRKALNDDIATQPSPNNKAPGRRRERNGTAQTHQRLQQQEQQLREQQEREQQTQQQLKLMQEQLDHVVANRTLDGAQRLEALADKQQRYQPPARRFGENNKEKYNWRKASKSSPRDQRTDPDKHFAE